MPDDSERESGATTMALAWIRDFMAALGELGPDVNASLLGHSVSAQFEVGDVRFNYVYDPRTSTPALSAKHFNRNVTRLRRDRKLAP